MYLVHTGKIWNEDLTAQELLNLEDGWDQEEQSVKRLKEKLGVTIINRQKVVSVGLSAIPGKIDGMAPLNKEYLWEHKAWASDRFDWFVARGMEAYPGEKCQANAYMLGTGLDECIFWVKKKENNDYHDIVLSLDKDYILPVIEWADKIRLEGWVPEPKLCDYCSYCGVRCFGAVIDFSWIKDANASEMVEKWKTGDKYVKVGEMLMQEARTYFTDQVLEKGRQVKRFPGLIGDEIVLLVEDLKVQRIIQNRFDVDKGLVIKYFGPEGLIKVGRENKVTQYRIQEVK